MITDVSGGFGRFRFPLTMDVMAGIPPVFISAVLLRKVPDEDPLPCGGTEKLRDEKFLGRTGCAKRGRKMRA